jgi:hypothetical protein
MRTAFVIIVTLATIVATNSYEQGATAGLATLGFFLILSAIGTITEDK